MEIRGLAELPAEWRDQLAREADSAVAARSFPGALFPALLVVFTASVTEIWACEPVATVVFSLLSIAAGIGRIWVARATPRWVKGPNLAGWRRAVSITMLASALTFGAFVGFALLRFGVDGTTQALLVEASAVLAGAIHIFAPFYRLLATAMALFLSILFAASLGSGAGLFAGLVALQAIFALGLARRMHREYWELAVARANVLRREEALKESRRQLHEVIEKSPDVMGLIRVGRIVFANAAWTASLEYSGDEIVGTRVEDHVHPDDTARLARLIALEEKVPHDLRFLTRSGATVIWAISPCGELDFAGQRAVLLVARDITEQTRMRAQLLVADRLAAIGTLAAGVAHEVNNPLMYMMANLEFLREELGGNVEHARMLADTYDGAVRVRDIVRDMRAFSRVDDTQLASVDVREVIELALRMTHNELRHRARIRCDVGEALVVRADRGKLCQVLVNLLVNAAQAMPENEADHEIAISARAAGEQIVIAVGDTGAGIAAEHLSRIFDPFFTTKPVGQGTGLGLYICHSAIRAVGGEMSVESRVGVGTTFTIKLPTATAQGSTRAEIKPSERAANRARVLVVDDDPKVGAVIARSLGEQYEVELFDSAQAVIARLRHGTAVDIVLCDLMMPVITGMDVFEQVTREQPQLSSRFIFMTGGTFTERAEQFLASTTNPFLLKPFASSELRSAVSARVGRVAVS